MNQVVSCLATQPKNQKPRNFEENVSSKSPELKLARVGQRYKTSTRILLAHRHNVQVRATNISKELTKIAREICASKSIQQARIAFFSEAIAQDWCKYLIRLNNFAAKRSNCGTKNFTTGHCQN